ncbi:MAG: hypothetical protein B7Z10_02945 [Rhodobacterales bacterium 32-66-7]|nr:MAG: hypothetical protein B7Z31_05725 [Rhodobacterales bacterium 12-65-15]OYX26540.1 MAG: hypothetical protein B7Z10_02945 [Rhodobacterales bacterium 32-66-7]
MPTGARAIGAVSFMVLGWLIANAYVANMPFDQAVGYLRELTAVIGFFSGWIVMGNSVGRGYFGAAGSGWKTMIVIVFWALLGFSVWEMLIISTKLRYDGPMEAAVDVFAIMLKRSQILFSVDCLAVFFVGGAIGGMLTEYAARRWP